MPHISRTLGDDASITRGDVLSAASGHGGDGRVQAKALLDAHGGEGQEGQILPGGQRMVAPRFPSCVAGRDGGNLSPFDLLRVPALEELTDLLTALLLVVWVVGQVVEQPGQPAGRRVVPCGGMG